MTLARRVAKLEASRTPTACVLAWLAEAHDYPTFPDYLASLLDAPEEAFPLMRIAAQVESTVRASTKGTPAEVWRSVRRAFGDACVLFNLVLRCNDDARTLRDFAGLRWALLVKWLGQLSAEAELAQRSRCADPEHLQREASDWRTALTISLSALQEEATVRGAIEADYFEGRPVLFHGLAHELADLLQRLEGLAGMADRLPDLRAADGSGFALDELRHRAEEAARQRTPELVTLARVQALEMLGERERAVATMERYLRPATLELLPAPQDGSGADADAARAGLRGSVPPGTEAPQDEPTTVAGVG